MQKTTATADQVLVRKLNTALILDALRSAGTISRARLAAGVGLNRSTVSSIIGELLDQGLVCETKLQTATNGRPGMLLEIDPNGGCAVGVEINVDFISIVLTDFTANVLWRRRLRIDAGETEEKIIAQAEELVQQALDEGRLRKLTPFGVGLGVPGLIDTDSGVLAFAPNLAWRDIPLGSMWRERFDLPIFLENDANAGALGEYYFGAAHQARNLIYISAGSGLGGGIILEGKVFRGVAGFAGELGHMKLDPASQTVCGCGKKGCWETAAGKLAIVRRMRKRLETNGQSLVNELLDGDLEQLRFATIVEAASQGDAMALEEFHETGRLLGVGISNLVHIFNPDMVVLGGALCSAAPYLLPEIEKTVERDTMTLSRNAVRIAASAHGPDACVMGGAALVLDAILRDPLAVRRR